MSVAHVLTEKRQKDFASTERYWNRRRCFQVHEKAAPEMKRPINAPMTTVSAVSEIRDEVRRGGGVILGLVINRDDSQNVYR